MLIAVFLTEMVILHKYVFLLLLFIIKLKVYGSLEKTTHYAAVMITKFRVVMELRPA